MGTIIIKTEGSGDSATTEPSTLTKGELAVNTQGGLLFHGNDSGATARFKATTLAGTNYSLFTVSGGKVVEIGAGTEDYVLTSTGTGSIPSWQAAGGSSATNLSGTTHASQYTVNSSSGNNVTIAEASGSIAGVMTVAHHDKLDGIESSATADQTNAEIRAAVEAASDSNVFTDADHSTLNGLGTISTQAANSVNIDGGAIDAVTIGTNSVVTELRVDNLKMGSSTNRIESTDTGGDIELYTEGGNGKVVIAGEFQINESTAVTEIENSDSLGTSDTKLCTQGNVKAYVDAQISGVGGGGGGSGTVSSGTAGALAHYASTGTTVTDTIVSNASLTFEGQGGGSSVSCFKLYREASTSGTNGIGRLEMGNTAYSSNRSLPNFQIQTQSGGTTQSAGSDGGCSVLFKSIATGSTALTTRIKIGTDGVVVDDNGDPAFIKNMNLSPGGTATMLINQAGAGAYTFDVAGSDERIKHERKPFDYGLKEIEMLKPEHFKYNKEAYKDFGLSEHDDKHFENDVQGLMAQDIEKIMPELVYEHEAGIKNYRRDGIMSALVNAVKELSARVAELEKEKTNV